MKAAHRLPARRHRDGGRHPRRRRACRRAHRPRSRRHAVTKGGAADLAPLARELAARRFSFEEVDAHERSTSSSARSGKPSGRRSAIAATAHDPLLPGLRRLVHRVRRHLKTEIDAAYRLPIPKITVSPHLVDICRQFYDDATYVGQIVDDDFYQPHAGTTAPRASCSSGRCRRTSRASTSATTRCAARARAEQRSISPRVAVGSGGWRAVGAGGGVPRRASPTEAMARLWSPPAISSSGRAGIRKASDCRPRRRWRPGVPAILSSIPSFRSWGEHDFALFVAEGDGSAMGDALVGAARRRRPRRRLAQRGREVAEQFRADATGERLERYFTARLPRRTSGR